MATYLAPTDDDKAYVLCADCGTAIESNGANLCVNCLRNSVDISEGIPRQTAIIHCRGCERFQSTKRHWMNADPESRELLALCLQILREKGLSKVHLVDAGFIWTEPHSRRIKIKLTIQKEVLSGTVLQQVFPVEFVIQGQQCPQCTKLAAKNTWTAMVQVRQKVDHKRTFLYLEQLILKHKADRDTLSLQEVKDGINFYFASRQSAQKMVDFLNSVVPIRVKTSERIISQDVHQSIINSKATFSAEIAPIVKDDLVCLPKKLAKQLGNIGQLVICHRVGTQMGFIDPLTLQMEDVSSGLYWRQNPPFKPFLDIKRTTEFIVLEIEPSNQPPLMSKNGRFMLADAQVTPASGSMDADSIFHTRTHLGNVLHAGDTVLGYWLGTSNYSDEDLAGVDLDRVPEIILVRKTYPDRPKNAKNRKWKLKSMITNIDETGHQGVGRAGLSADADYELFLRDLEEDEEMRQGVNLYKRDNVPVASQDDDMASGDVPTINMDELLDDIDDLDINDVEMEDADEI